MFYPSSLYSQNYVDDLINVLFERRDLKDYKDRQSGSGLSQVINDIYQELNYHSSHLARNVLCRNPSIISDTNLGKIIDCLPRNSLGQGVEINKKEFLRVISEHKNFNDCCCLFCFQLAFALTFGFLSFKPANLTMMI